MRSTGPIKMIASAERRNDSELTVNTSVNCPVAETRSPAIAGATAKAMFWTAAIFPFASARRSWSTSCLINTYSPLANRFRNVPATNATTKTRMRPSSLFS